MNVPKWLKDRIGVPTRGRGCKATKCLVCQQSILAGLDEDQMAMPALVDPIPLSPLGEALALMDGRHTYKLARHKQGLALWRRTHFNIRAHPASEETIVVADHKCGGPKFPAVEIQSLPARSKKGLPYDDEPPF